MDLHGEWTKEEKWQLESNGFILHGNVATKHTGTSLSKQLTKGRVNYTIYRVVTVNERLWTSFSNFEEAFSNYLNGKIHNLK